MRLSSGIVNVSYIKDQIGWFDVRSIAGIFYSPG